MIPGSDPSRPRCANTSRRCDNSFQEPSPTALVSIFRNRLTKDSSVSCEIARINEDRVVQLIYARGIIIF